MFSFKVGRRVIKAGDLAVREAIFADKRRRVESKDVDAYMEAIDDRVLDVELGARNAEITRLTEANAELAKRIAHLEGDNQQLVVNLDNARKAIDLLEARLSNVGVSFERERNKEVSESQQRTTTMRKDASSTPRRPRRAWSSMESRSRAAHKEKLANFVRPLVTNGDGKIDVDGLKKLSAEVFAHLAPDFALTPTMLAEDDLAMIKKTSLSWKSRQTLQQELVKNGCNTLASYNSVYHLNRAKVDEIKDYFESGNAELEHKDSCGSSVVGPSGYARVKSTLLPSLIMRECDRLDKEGLMHFDEFDETIWLAFQTDKGGGSVKSGISIMNSKRANSPYYVLPICTYYGEETYVNYLNVMTPLFLKMREMKTVSVGGIDRAIVWHGIADFSCKNVLCGLKSPAHTFPCAECEFRIGTIANANTIQRTRERLEERLLEYQDQFLVGMKEDEAAKISKGVIEESLLPFPPKNFTTSQVHILTGPGAQLLSYLEGEAITKDLSELGSVRVLRCMEERVKVEKELEGGLKGHADKIKNLQLAISDGEKIEKGLAGTLRASNLQCGSMHCLHGSCFNGKLKLRRANAWSTVTCGGCKVGFHSVCAALLSDAMFASGNMRCPWCEKWTIARLKREITTGLTGTKNQLDAANGDMITERVRINKELAVIRGKGRWYSALKTFMGSKGVSRALWFQSYSGREVRTILKDATLETCFDLLHLSKSGTLWDAMNSFRSVVEMAKPKFLNNDEIDKVETSAKMFVQCYRVLHPTADRSVKFHYLDSHFIPYVRQFKTFGMATEQAIEHFHALFNEYEGRFRCLGNPGPRLARIMMEHIISSPYMRGKGTESVKNMRIIIIISDSDRVGEGTGDRESRDEQAVDGGEERPRSEVCMDFYFQNIRKNKHF